MEFLYLSRRNLLTLLSKLDRKAAGDITACTLVKLRQPDPTRYNQTMDECWVTAVENDEYYGAQNRPAGEVHPLDGGVFDK